MELTRRDVLAALAAAGVVGAGAHEYAERDGGSADPPLTDHETATLVAVAEVAYPSAVSNVPDFARRYSVARVNDDADYRAGVREAVADLDDACTSWFDDRFAALDDDDARADALHEIGAVVATPDPSGGRSERIRHYLVNELLYALYTSPTGAGLAGLENPPGYPGGDTSYQRGPQ
ncbi:hypothetical protein MBEHAL_1364 [Halarchaeum acidiphilum MH1-52-1]|uniref:Gluconate 2-dehydrogenase subunit 3 family protein n=1 Tax=Halarchaeum acidiphilum MH1-52-1 TaxID=1261545 RepID=U3A4N4_9EURY|nr:hypothetical protein [Halarchaeum acidiphilum]GAD52604.1 hypothetical protein MBEHAL_1364 [Halarchaeum acidiphilum MH1-52-1]